ncbi:MAG TPA: 3-phosphoshikimate 1-carboxyvinyltransferase, partial [Flavobacteriales bacterium]|nr:3-phosphoshikimate 1-carboxyvinyltransferase [Flavobacteriales bacterium]
SPGGALTGTLRVPGDKSISHRSMMLGSLAQGRSTVSGLLQGEDVLSTMRAFQQMGVRIEATPSGDWEVWGNGLQGLQKPDNALDLGNSGTSMRLMSGILAAQPFAVTLTGDHSLSQRPMQRVLTPLAKMGASIQSAENGRPPLVFAGNRQLTGIDYALPVASAQVKSAILLAGLYASGTTRITEPALLRDHTERMLQGMGVALQVDGSQITLPSGRRELRPISIDVPADISSAAFFLVGASIAKGSDLLLEHVGINPSRIGVMNILKLMGADIEVINERQCSGEPVADLRVRYAPLQGIRIPVEQVPL